MFQNPFLRPGTPQRTPYGRYVRLFVILVLETPGPRSREITIFGVNATRRAVKRSADKALCQRPKPTGNAPGLI